MDKFHALNQSFSNCFYRAAENIPEEFSNTYVKEHKSLLWTVNSIV